MLIVYASSTGNVQRFIESLDMRALSVNDIGDGIVDEPFILVTYTTGFGQVPDEVVRFLERNHKKLVAVSASGNRNFGNNFAVSANKIAYRYNVPILLKFELQGVHEDREKFKERVYRIYEIHRTK